MGFIINVVAFNGRGFITGIAPAAITGSTSLCAPGYQYPTLYIALSDSVPGGSWSSSNPGVATVNSSGIVTSVAPGNTTISYTTGGGTATLNITVNDLPIRYDYLYTDMGNELADIAISNSQIGVNYYFYTPIGTWTYAGTGGFLYGPTGTWNNAGDYGCYGVIVSTGCSEYMIGSYTVT